ncbi:MAG TPA: PilZ domain-containing protein [Bradyrhizobium sp.]
MSVERFLKQRAVNVVVEGTYILHRWYDPQGRLRTLECRATRVSPFRMIVDVPVVGRVGDRITSYFSEFGEFDGNISDTRRGRILLELEMTPEKREWMADKLTWLEKKQKDPTVQEERKNARLIPQTSNTTLTLADGRVHTCIVIDVSATGVAVSSDLQPTLGMPLAIGSCVGRVVRVFPSGFAVRFVESKDVDELRRLIVRSDQVTGEGSPPIPVAV